MRSTATQEAQAARAAGVAAKKASGALAERDVQLRAVLEEVQEAASERFVSAAELEQVRERAAHEESIWHAEEMRTRSAAEQEVQTTMEGAKERVCCAQAAAEARQALAELEVLVAELAGSVSVTLPSPDMWLSGANRLRNEFADVGEVARWRALLSTGGLLHPARRALVTLEESRAGARVAPSSTDIGDSGRAAEP